MFKAHRIGNSSSPDSTVVFISTTSFTPEGWHCELCDATSPNAGTYLAISRLPPHKSTSALICAACAAQIKEAL